MLVKFQTNNNKDPLQTTIMIKINNRASVGTPISQESSWTYSCWITLGINMERCCLSKCSWWSEKQGGWHESLHGTCCKINQWDLQFNLPREKGSLFFWRQSRQEMGGKEENKFRYLFLLFLPRKSPISGFLHTSLFCSSITALFSCPSDCCWDPDWYSLQNNALVWKHRTNSAPNSPCSSIALFMHTMLLLVEVSHSFAGESYSFYMTSQGSSFNQTSLDVTRGRITSSFCHIL